MNGAAFLSIGAGPRAVGMGGAQAAVVDDSYASYWNPAGLAQLDRSELALAYQRSFQNVQEQHANVAYPLRKGSAGSVRDEFVGAVFSLSMRAEMAPVRVGSSEGHGVAYGLKAGRYASIGGVVKLIRSELGSAEATSHAVDAGALMRVPLSLKIFPVRGEFRVRRQKHGPRARL